MAAAYLSTGGSIELGFVAGSFVLGTIRGSGSRRWLGDRPSLPALAMAIIDRPPDIREPPHYPEQDWTIEQLTEQYEQLAGESIESVFPELADDHDSAGSASGSDGEASP